MDDATILRRRLDDGRRKTGRLGADRATTLGIALYEVVTAPATAPGIAMCHPVSLDAVEATGGSATVATDADVQVPVVVLRVPAVGERLRCVLIDGSWVATRGATGAGDCAVSLVVYYVCDPLHLAPVGGTIVVYSSHDGSCSGSVLLTTTSGDLSTIPDGTYDVHITPGDYHGAYSYDLGAVIETKPRCKTITIDRTACAGGTLVLPVHVEPKYYNVAVRIGGQCGTLDLADVRVHDGTNDVTLHAANYASTYFYFHNLLTPPNGSTLHVDVSGLDYCHIEPYSYELVLTLDPDDPEHYGLCNTHDVDEFGSLPVLTYYNPLPTPSAGYAWYGGCQCPGPSTCTYTDDTGSNVLTPILSATPGVIDYWEGCITLGDQAVEWKNPAPACPDGPIPIGGKYVLSGSPALAYVRVTPHGDCSPLGVWYTVDKRVPVGYYFDCDDTNCPPSGHFAAFKQPDISGTPITVTCDAGTGGGGLHAISGGVDYITYWVAGGDTDLYDCGATATGTLGVCPSADPCQDVASLCGDYTLDFS